MSQRGTRRWSRFAAGVSLWGALILIIGLVAGAHGREIGEPVGKLARFALARPRTLELTLVSGWDLIKGDPLLSKGDRRPLGRVLAVERTATEIGPITSPGEHPSLAGTAPVATYTYAVTIALDPETDADVVARAPMRIGAAPGDARWIYDTLLTTARREKLKKELEGFLDEHG